MRKIKFDFILQNGDDFFRTNPFTLEEIIDFVGVDIIYEEESFWQNGKEYFSVEEDIIRNFKVVARREYSNIFLKSGVELVEGDICVQKVYGDSFQFQIIVENGCFMAKGDGVSVSLSVIQQNEKVHNCSVMVIGNIYEGIFK